MELILINKSNKLVKVKLKDIITAEMRVNYIQIYRKYDSIRLKFIERVFTEDFDTSTLSDNDYLILLKIQNHINAKNINADALLVDLYGFEIIKELLPSLLINDTVSDKAVLEMLNDVNNDLWNNQDLEELQKALNSFRAKI